MSTAAEYGVVVKQRHAGETFSLGSVRFTALSPPAGWVLKEKVRDDDGMVLRAESGQRSLLLAADVGKKIEDAAVLFRSKRSANCGRTC